MEPSSSRQSMSEPVSPAIGMSGSTTDTLGWRPAPNGLGLVQVHYLVRHGERTPVRTRLTDAKPPIPERWNMCHIGEQFRSAVLDVRNAGVDSSSGILASGVPIEIQSRKGVESTGRDGLTVLKPQKGECMLGELTDLGRATTNLLGHRLRRLYVEQLGLLPPRVSASDAEKVYFRSTNMERTIESLHSLVGGLLPETKNDGQAPSFVPTMLVRNGVSENLLPNTFGCARLRELDRMFSKFAAKIHNPLLSALDGKLSPQMNGYRPRLDGHPQLSGVLDTIRAAKSHGLAIPAAFEDPALMNQIETAVCDEWYSGYRSDDKEVRDQFQRLSMGRFLNELTNRLHAKAHRPASTPLNLAVYAAHDTSLAGVLATLDVFDNRWPAFTSSIGVELFAGKGGLLSQLGLTSKPHYVRMRYGDKEVRLPACKAKGDHLPGHEEFCTLEAFARATNQLRHPRGMTWEQECDSKADHGKV